jgi:thiamine biosynthesis lipoprotein
MMDIYRFDFKAMGCSCEVVTACSVREFALSAVDAAIQEITRIEQKYSRYHPESVISRINSQAGVDSVACDQETIALLRYAGALFDLSGGLFDATSGVLRRAWDFSKQSLPEKGSIEGLLELVGWNNVECDGNSVRLVKKGMQIDLGGIGKEYAADRAAEILHEKGVLHGYVNMSGDIRVVGAQHDGAPWLAGVRDPRCTDKMFASIPLYGGGLATSGDYERYMEVGGRRYCHIIDPRTGFPVDSWSSITVAARTASEAGSCATIAMLKGGDCLDYLEASGMTYLAVDRSGKIYHRD